MFEICNDLNLAQLMPSGAVHTNKLLEARLWPGRASVGALAWPPWYIHARRYIVAIRKTIRQYESPHRSEIKMTPEQCRMARAGLAMGVRDLAAATGVSTNTITRFERGEQLKLATVERLKNALEAAGIEFISENGGGAGVRLRRPGA